MAGDVLPANPLPRYGRADGLPVVVANEAAAGGQEASVEFRRARFVTPGGVQCALEQGRGRLVYGTARIVSSADAGISEGALAGFGDSPGGVEGSGAD